MRDVTLLSSWLVLLASCGTPPAERVFAPASSSASPAAERQPKPPPARERQSAVVAPGPAPDGEGEPAPDPVAAEVAEVLARTPADSVSIGAPGDGRVEGALALPLEGPGFIHNDKRPREARYGTVELVQAIIRAAAVVDRELPGSRLVVNDLGLEGGGPIAQHGSHQAGRDADILFYVLDEDGEPLRSVGVPIDPQGMGWDFKELPVAEDDVRVRIDLPRTWRFMQALVEEAGEQIQRIFIVEHVRTMLLEEAERVRAPAAARERFAMVSCQPGTPHDDHMHLRLYCAPDDIAAGCLDKAPIYPWHKQALAELGLAPVMEKVGRRARKARDSKVAKRTTTRAQARARAGPMHRKVRQFLDEREQWAKMPHPGRPYCR